MNGKTQPAYVLEFKQPIFTLISVANHADARGTPQARTYAFRVLVKVLKVAFRRFHWLLRPA